MFYGYSGLLSVYTKNLFGSFILQVGRAGRFGTKGLAITFVASASDSDVLNQVSPLAFMSLFGWHS